MNPNNLPFRELMEAVLDLLKSQKYMDSTLMIYSRFYNRVHAFLKQHDTETYSPELGKEFISCQKVSQATYGAYSAQYEDLMTSSKGKSIDVITEMQKLKCRCCFQAFCPSIYINVKSPVINLPRFMQKSGHVYHF